MCSEPRDRRRRALTLVASTAALLALLLALGAPACAQAPALHVLPAEHTEALERAAVSDAPSEESQTRSARELTLRARERFDAGDYEAALAELTRAYETLGEDPRRAALLNDIAVCHERSFRYDLALRYYERYLREAQTDDEDRREVEAVMRGLSGLLGTLHITSNARAEVWIDDRAFGWAPGNLEVPAGKRVVKLQARGREVMQRELMVVPRATQTVHFELERLPEYHGITATYFWTGVGLTAALAVTGVGLSLAALSTHHDNEALQAQDLLLPEDEEHKHKLAVAADVSLAAAGVFAVSSLVLYFVTDFRGPARRPAEDRATSLRLTPSFGKGIATLQLSRALP